MKASAHDKAHTEAMVARIASDRRGTFDCTGAAGWKPSTYAPDRSSLAGDSRLVPSATTAKAMKYASTRVTCSTTSSPVEIATTGAGVRPLHNMTVGEAPVCTTAYASRNQPVARSHVADVTGSGPHRELRPQAAAMAAATDSQTASNALRVKPAPDGSQLPVLPPASV